LRRADIRRAVRRWAATVDRPLPWRGERDPYRVLVSEVMLQQTQAARVGESYTRFLDRFPTVGELAAAESADVLRAWENLGYNRRALALWRAAREIGARGFPLSVDELERLPGVGPYTARAVASFAFGADVAAVDANVKRVVERMVRPADVQAFADDLVPRGRAAEWNQAMIDLGALVCTARSPSCECCPLRRGCAWARGERATARGRPPAEPFASTSRYVRGRIVAELRRRRRVERESLRSRVGVTRERFDAALAGLVRDEIVSMRGRDAVLGVSERASGARRRREPRTASRRG
jgi:A/G-specific adenine glycosylase